MCLKNTFSIREECTADKSYIDQLAFQLFDLVKWYIRAKLTNSLNSLNFSLKYKCSVYLLMNLTKVMMEFIICSNFMFILLVDLICFPSVTKTATNFI